MAHHATPGWFGKLSMLGDFASRRLDPAWIESCDRWLSASMQASQQQLGHDWLQTYLSAPVWRFAWAPGVVDQQWWFGVLMPSCDNVGRYFPLLIAQAREHEKRVLEPFGMQRAEDLKQTLRRIIELHAQAPGEG